MAKTKRKIKLPDAAEVADELYEVARELRQGDLEEDDYVDVRLQVSSSGDWSVHYGDASYDQDHRGYWGASGVTLNSTKAECRSIAEDLIGEAADAMAQDDVEIED